MAHVHVLRRLSTEVASVVLAEDVGGGSMGWRKVWQGPRLVPVIDNLAAPGVSTL